MENDEEERVTEQEIETETARPNVSIHIFFVFERKY